MSDERILILDTEKNVLLTYKAVLEEVGYHVDIVTTIEETVQKIANESYGVLVTELYLKGLSTLSLIEDLHRERPEIYIIMVTATLLSPENYASVLEAGVQDCFSKPFSTQNLLLHIDKGLKTRSLYSEKKKLEEKILTFEQFFLNQNTMVYDNHHFIKALQQEQRRAERYKHSFSIISIELNSTEEDSTCESSLTPLLLSNLRSTDYITHFNDHYSLILPETSKIGGITVNKRLEEKIVNLSLDRTYNPSKKPSDNITFTIATYPDESKKISGWINDFEKKIDAEYSPSS